MTFQIEQNIPLYGRSAHSSRGKEILATLQSMNTGDSFLVNNDNKREAGSTVCLVRIIAKKNGMMITSRATKDDGYRIWRVQ
tara:strand:+ start:2372 stop:2617 length:246 start_codon:yes stop_codon:yes gene_type:complete